MERIIERLIVLSRWLLVPFYLGLVIALITLLGAFARELFGALENMFWQSEHQAIVRVLSMVDLTLVAGLIVIVIFSGYENVVSRLDPGGPRDWPAWLVTVDFGGLKKKLFAAMAAISAVTMLKALMRLEEAASERQLTWLVTINAMFIFGYVAVALADRLAEPAKVRAESRDGRPEKE